MDNSIPASLTFGSHNVKGVADFAAICTAVACLSVMLRFWSRATLSSDGGARFSWDDWLALATVPAIIASTVFVFDAIKHGLGVHILVSPLSQVKGLVKDIYFIQVFLVLAIGLPKLSALALYGRIFGAKKGSRPLWRAALWTTVVITIAWIISSLLVTVFQCVPVQAVWDPTVPSRCMNTSSILVPTAIVDAIIQLPILLLPVQPLIELDMPRRKKLLLVLLFLVGYICPIMAVGRLVTEVKQGDSLQMDITYTVVPVAYWWIAEYGLSVVTVCMPAVFHLVARGRESGFRALFNNRDGAPKAFGRSFRSRLNRYTSAYKWRQAAQQTEKIPVATYDSGIVPVLRSAHEEKIPAATADHEPSQLYLPYAAGNSMTFEEALRMQRA